MPDVIVIGGGIIGATTAWQLAERGAEVLLLERGHLASGATRRSQGLLLEPEVDPMQPLFAESNRLYDHLAERAGLDLALDQEPIGTLFLATSEAQLERLAENVPAEGRLLDRDAVLEAEPGLAPTVSGGLLLPGGRRTDPTALTAGRLAPAPVSEAGRTSPRPESRAAGAPRPRAPRSARGGRYGHRRTRRSTDGSGPAASPRNREAL